MADEHLDVLIVGAGLSGIGAARYLQDKCPWASWSIFESRGAIGGTWDLFRYPGIRSDSDMFTLGYSFRPWTGDKSIADGASILQYIRDTAAETHVDEQVRFHHRITSLDWSTEDARWAVVAERTDTGETVRLTAGFVFSCSGYYRYDHGYQPELPGVDDYQGELVHPQAWPQDLEYAGKRIVVIGSGATAMTLIPSLAKTAEHVTMLQRSPTYVVALPARNPAANLLRKVLPKRWQGPAIRWMMALGTQFSYQLSRRRPAFMKKVLRKGVTEQLPADFDVDKHFTPKYDPWDQRLCVVPDGDLFKSIRAGTSSVVTDHIDSFTATGIRLRSGEELAADVVVTATGLEVLFLGGIELSVDGEQVVLPDHLTYKGMMIEGVPNLAIAIGYTNASWTLKCDLTCDYVCRVLNHLRETGLRQATAVDRTASASREPLLGLSSGYLQRAAHLLPKQGTKQPWQVHQSYLKDYRALKLSSIEDDTMQFTNPQPRPARTPVPSA
ncbi:NAD(P)/FAD-dependent oxidoreductase [Aquihabitans sp. G128]|uniref:flavin-containing monooxygenase n=1 Tax=Aquihabitans sp. G128 TaxID=2849779 RepID=UPI001C22BD35|nr:NAD(P)/FAD-dependent oxidoreductase [Aquihabitans sp. G128]QXC60707.1 NAD(P)/FAD-dependent oxidoreductase [Aquihabitans sp. G128]